MPGIGESLDQILSGHLVNSHYKGFSETVDVHLSAQPHGSAGVPDHQTGLLAGNRLMEPFLRKTERRFAGNLESFVPVDNG